MRMIFCQTNISASVFWLLHFVTYNKYLLREGEVGGPHKRFQSYNSCISKRKSTTVIQSKLNKIACKQALAAGREKEGETGTTSVEFEYLRRKSRCEMLISGDDISKTSLPLARVFQCMFTFSFVSPSRWLAEIWQLSRRGATGELEVEFKFQRRSCKLSSPPERPGELSRRLKTK